MDKLILSLCVLLPSIALAQTAPELIDARQRAFSLIEKQSEHIEGMIDEEAPNWREIEVISHELVMHSQLLKTAFSEGSQEGSQS